jgi:Zn-finger nucleic acid-binding protein
VNSAESDSRGMSVRGSRGSGVDVRESIPDWSCAMTYPCPKCRNRELEPIPGYEEAPPLPEAAGMDAELGEEVLLWPGPPLRCRGCRGLWMPRQRLAELSAAGVQAPPGSNVDPAVLAREKGVDGRAGLCPIGHGFLTRARVDLDSTFYLDRCAHCGGIWFDPGEWTRLAGSPLLEHLDDLWDAGWRRRVRQEQAREKHREFLRKTLGDTLLERLNGLAEVLRSHPGRSTALAFLIEASIGHEEVEGAGYSGMAVAGGDVDVEEAS